MRGARGGALLPPTLFTDAHPASTVAQVEIFGPVVASTTFRTPAEAVELANHTRYGLAASVWTENVNLALDIAPKLKAGVVWVNCTNLFDAASGFGGYRESGFGREGGREELLEYLKPSWEKGLPLYKVSGGGAQKSVENQESVDESTSSFDLPPIDRTPKLYIGGKQTRPDSGYSLPVFDAKGSLVGEVGEGNRKDRGGCAQGLRVGQGDGTCARPGALLPR